MSNNNNKETNHKNDHYTKNGKLKNNFYEKELLRLQEEMVKIQYWVKEQNLRVVIVFEGRDAAGKGGVIKRITERTNPRVVRVVALGIPTDREKNPGISSVGWPIFRPAARSPSSTAVGTPARSPSK